MNRLKLQCGGGVHCRHIQALLHCIFTSTVGVFKRLASLGPHWIFMRPLRGYGLEGHTSWISDRRQKTYDWGEKGGIMESRPSAEDNQTT